MGKKTTYAAQHGIGFRKNGEPYPTKWVNPGDFLPEDLKDFRRIFQLTLAFMPHIEKMQARFKEYCAKKGVRK
ncbi:MAG: hypothetical protein LBU89_00800 [Fibromonadaceae bacterium]|jgi:hypothetical protein|nr:hypothetical protein [Fibromonadaceae bacterium]